MYYTIENLRKSSKFPLLTFSQVNQWDHPGQRKQPSLTFLRNDIRVTIALLTIHDHYTKEMRW